MKQMINLSEKILANNDFAELHEIVVDYIKNNECALALDLLCEYIIEHGIAVNKMQFNSIVDLAKEFSSGSIVLSDQTLSQLRKLRVGRG